MRSRETCAASPEADPDDLHSQGASLASEKQSR